MADANLDIRVTSKGIKEAHLALQKLGINADKAEDAVRQYKDETKKSTTAQKQYATQQAKTNVAVSQAAKVHKEARGGFRAMRGATQQVSFQLQDIAVQAQSGTAGLTILAQQGPQLLSVFGPAGAVAGAFVAFGALIAGVLLPSLMDSEDKVDNLGEALDRLKSATDRTKGGVLALSEEFATLARESGALAELELAIDASKIEKGLEQSIGKIEEGFNFPLEIQSSLFQAYQDKGVNKSVNDLSTVSLAGSKKIRAFGESIGLTAREASDLGLAFGKFKEQRTPELFDELQATFKRLRGETTNTEAYDKLADIFVNQARSIRAGTKALEDNAAVTAMIQEGKLKTVASLEAEERARKELSAAVQEEIDNRDKLVNLNRTSMSAALSREVKETADAEREKAELVERTQKILSTLYSETSPAVLSFARQQQTILAILKESHAKGAMEEEAFIAAKKRIREDYAAFVQEQEDKAELIEAQRQARELQRAADLAYAKMSLVEKWMFNTQQAINNVDAMYMMMAVNLESSIATAFEGILTGTMTVKEAFVDFTKSMLQSFLTMIAQMAAKRLALFAVEKLIGKTTAASAATYMGLNAAAMSIQAGLNAFASTAAIPVVGPAAAPAAMATAIGITAPLASAVSALSTSAAAARATGGQVRGGQSYLVGERGPELLTMGGSGRISSNDQLKNAVGGGGGITIINNVDARGADASVDQKIRAAMKQTAESTTQNIQNLMRRRRFV
jgi:hypothetical protein